MYPDVHSLGGELITIREVKEDPIVNPVEDKGPKVANSTTEVLVVNPNWTVSYMAYLLRKELPEDGVEARQILS